LSILVSLDRWFRVVCGRVVVFELSTT